MTQEGDWGSAAAGWTRWAGQGADYLGPATTEMLDRIGVGPGQRVLDLACGSGEQSLLAARRVGDAGHVLATDLAPAMIAATRANAEAAGLANISTEVASAEWAGKDAEPFDAVICRLGLMLFPDPAAALAGAFARLKPGGGFAAIVPGPMALNPFNAVALEILARHGGKPAPTDGSDPFRPGIFALARPERLQALGVAAGFIDVAVTQLATTRHMASAADAAAMIRDGFAFYRAMVADLPATAQDTAWAEVTQALTRFEGSDGFAGPGAVNLVIGRKPAPQPGIVGDLAEGAADLAIGIASIFLFGETT